jgi:glycosyltransferase involved in cell wall biosynthesis
MIGCTILAPPRVENATIRKGAVILTDGDDICRALPDVRSHFFIIERRGWRGMNKARCADIKMVEDLTTWEKTRRRFPGVILLDIASADFVDPDVFQPLGKERIYTGIQIARWDRFKRHELFVRAAGLLPEHRFLKFGHFALRGTPAEKRLREKIISLAERLRARIEFPDAEAESNQDLRFSAKRVNRLINQCRMGILTSRDEGINKFKLECMSAGVPVLVPDDACPPLRKHVTPETGLFYKPSPAGLAKAVRICLETYPAFRSRDYVLENTGCRRSVFKLRHALAELCAREGVKPYFQDVFWDGRRHFWGERALDELRRAIAGEVAEESDPVESEGEP